MNYTQQRGRILGNDLYQAYRWRFLIKNLKKVCGTKLAIVWLNDGLDTNKKKLYLLEKNWKMLTFFKRCVTVKKGQKETVHLFKIRRKKYHL